MTKKLKKEMIAQQIIQMAQRDKSARNENPLDWNKIRLIDAENRAKIKQFVKKYGYINPEIFGEKASKSAWLLIQHFPISSLKFMEFYLKLVKENDKNFSRATLALLEDRINVSKKQPQVYGTQAYCEPNSDIFYFREIKDIKNIDEIRASVGLETLAEYAKSMEEEYGDKFVLPEGYNSKP
jgi:hypothetical protein